jgi:hypothetical protein
MLPRRPARARGRLRPAPTAGAKGGAPVVWARGRYSHHRDRIVVEDRGHIFRGELVRRVADEKTGFSYSTVTDYYTPAGKASRLAPNSDRDATDSETRQLRMRTSCSVLDSYCHWVQSLQRGGIESPSPTLGFAGSRRGMGAIAEGGERRRGNNAPQTAACRQQRTGLT